MFDKPGVFYSNNPFTIFDSNWLLDNSKIQDLKKYKFVILDFSSEHYGIHGLDHVYHAVDNSGLNFVLLSHEPSDNKKFDRMYFYPHWYHWSKQGFVVSKTADPFNKKYKWSCLNLRPRPHRIYNYIYSRRQPYFKDSIFSFYKSENAEKNLENELDSQTLSEWQSLRDSLPHITSVGESDDFVQTFPANPKLYVKDDSRCDLPANSDSYIHLVTETTVCPRVFVSEKTWKPIAAGQFFLIFGNPGTVGYLRHQGVDVFDDLIDHSYDSINDWHARLHQIHKQIEQLVSRDLKQLYINTASRRQANTEKFFSGQFDNQYLKTIQECINTLS